MEDSTKEVIEIANDIISRVKEEQGNHVRQPAIGRVEFSCDGKSMKRWLIRREGQMGSEKVRDITGAVITTAEGQKATLNFADFIWRDSLMGGLIVATEVGKEVFRSPRTGQEQLIDISTYSIYITDIHHANALDGSIKTVAVKSFSFQSLKDAIQELERKINLVAELELEAEEKKKFDIEAEDLTEKIESEKKEISALKEKIRKHIIKSVSLRMRPVLDKEQDQIRRSKILNGSLIIDGGPGTGKTTSLIQRITFLTARTIEEYKFDLTPADKELLYNQDTSWVFFSPTELLRLYLKEAMIQEGLMADDKRVFVWDNYRDNLFRLFKLINPETNRPFQNLRSEIRYFSMNGKMAFELFREFDNYFITNQDTKLSRVSNLNVFKFAWRDLGLSIVDTIKKKEITNIEDLIDFYNRLNLNFQTKAQDIFKQYQALIKKLSSETQIRIKSDKSIYAWLEEELLKEFKTKASTAAEQEEEDEMEFEEESEELTTKEFNFEVALNNKLRVILRKIALGKFDDNTRLTRKEKELIIKLEHLIIQDEFDQLGQLAYFRKFFEKILKGHETNVLKEVPQTYKSFRREFLSNAAYLTKEGQALCQEILSPQNPNEKRNIKVHPEEKDLILSIIFRLVRKIYHSYPKLYENSSNLFISTYKQSLRATIAIDEATDFSVLQLYCMSALSHPKFNSVTLSGDLMQRMNTRGISDWKDYIALFPGTLVSTMKRSYRQTHVLLQMAQKIYQEKLKQKADFFASTPNDPFDPKPLLFQSESFEDKIEWITGRIIEIYNYYSGNIPTIAIFTKDDNEAVRVSSTLNDQDLLIQNDLKVEACLNGKLLGDATVIRVFSVEYIKGLEFQAVFFLDIDNYAFVNKDLLGRYIYVGLSRASFFLAVTVEKQFPVQLAFIENDFYKNLTW